jgi:transcriptional regulator with GAF, ATPase, and Fis domain
MLAVAEALECAGVTTSSLNLAAPSGPGVLCFSAISQHLCEFLCELSRNGIERVIAVALPATHMANQDAWRLIQAGASDVLAWDSVATPATVIAARLERWKAIDTLLTSPLVQHNLVGLSSAWIAVLRQVVEVAHFTDAAVLITGETGTGKELVARLIHSLDLRSDKRDLIVLDCTTIVPELSGSEFFGHERGAFTNAVAPRDGAFALADGGTLFLDEVGELPLGLQAQLLRAVQEHVYKRVGSNTWHRTKFRLVCATNRDLLQEEARGQFRRDLYYRIATWSCKLPALHERLDDVIPLVRHFIRQFRPDQEPPDLDEPVRQYLLTRDYPGNVRDLKQLVFRLMCRHVGPGPITIGDIPAEERPAAAFATKDWHDAALEPAIRQALAMDVGLKDMRRIVEEIAVRIAIDDENGNLQRAAHKLGVTDRALQIRRATRRQQLDVSDDSERFN